MPPRQESLKTVEIGETLRNLEPSFLSFGAEEQQLVYDSSMKLYQQTAAVDDLLEPVVLPEESEESVALEPCAICGWANVEHGEHSR